MTALQSDINRMRAQYNLIIHSDLFSLEDVNKICPPLLKQINDAEVQLNAASKDREVQGAVTAPRTDGQP